MYVVHDNIGERIHEAFLVRHFECHRNEILWLGFIFCIFTCEFEIHRNKCFESCDWNVESIDGLRHILILDTDVNESIFFSHMLRIREQELRIPKWVTIILNEIS